MTQGIRVKRGDPARAVLSVSIRNSDGLPELGSGHVAVALGLGAGKRCSTPGDCGARGLITFVPGLTLPSASRLFMPLSVLLSDGHRCTGG